MRDGEKWFKYTEDTYCTPDFTDKALDILKASDDKPKFVFLAYNAPHLPIQAPGDDINEMRNDYEAAYTTGKTYSNGKTYNLERPETELSNEVLTYHAMIRSIDQAEDSRTCSDLLMFAFIMFFV